MPELTEKKIKIVTVVLDWKAKYVRVADWDGESLSFILADEMIV